MADPILRAPNGNPYNRPAASDRRGHYPVSAPSRRAAKRSIARGERVFLHQGDENAPSDAITKTVEKDQAEFGHLITVSEKVREATSGPAPYIRSRGDLADLAAKVARDVGRGVNPRRNGG